MERILNKTPLTHFYGRGCDDNDDDDDNNDDDDDDDRLEVLL